MGICGKSWVTRLPIQFVESGLEHVKCEFGREHAWQRKLASDTACALVDEMASTVFDQHSSESEELRNTVRGAFQEICEGAYISQPFCVAVGRKRKV